MWGGVRDRLRRTSDQRYRFVVINTDPNMGLRFHAAHREERRTLFAAQLQKLGLFRHILELLQAAGPLSETRAMEELSAALPYDNPQQLLHTMVAWGRYAGLLDYDFTGKRLLRLGGGKVQRA